MNLTGALVAVSLMAMGSAGTLYYMSDPPIALARLSAQAQADSIVDTLQLAIRRGKRVKFKDCSQSPANPADVVCNEAFVYSQLDPMTGDYKERFDIKKISGCDFLDQYDGKQGFFVRCQGSGSSQSPKEAKSRMAVVRLIGANPCDSDLFPLPSVKPASDQDYLCRELLTDEPPGFPTDPPTVSSPPPSGDPLIGGHFDLDSYTHFNAKGLHVHAWDDKYNLGKFDLMLRGPTPNMNDSTACRSTVCPPLGAPKSLSEVITDPNRKFRLLAVNPALSPLINITVTYGTGGPVTCSQSTGFDACFGTAAAPRVFDQNTNNSDGAVELKSLVVSVVNNAHSAAGIIPTSTGMVNTSNNRYGKGCEYRNGAFIIQAVDGSGAFLSGQLNSNMPVTNGQPCSAYISNGGIGLATTNVIY